MTDSDALQDLAANKRAELPKPAERARLRNLFGITQEKLAGALGVTRRTIHAWEHGNTDPTGENRERYAEILALWQAREHENRANPTQSYR